MSSPFPLPLIFTAWGFRAGGDRWNNADSLGDWCNACNIKTVAVQLGFEGQATRPQTLPEDVKGLRNKGLSIAVWGVADGVTVINELKRLGCTEDEWMPQIEGPYERDYVYRACSEFNLKPRAIVTTYSGAGAEDNSDVQKLRDLGVKAAYVECYSEAPRHELVDLMLWQGTRYGWKEEELFAVPGTYRGEMPSVYHGIENVGSQFGLYLAEPMQSQQWVAWGKQAAIPPPIVVPEPPPAEEVDVEDPVTDTEAREGVVFAAHAREQNWPDPKPKSRLTVCRRIADVGNDDVKWNKCRDVIVKALDAAGIP